MYLITLLSTNGMHELTANICSALNTRGLCCEHHALREETFPDGEAWSQAPVSVRNHEVYLVHDMRWPDVNNAIMQFTIAVDMLKRASVERIHAVLPYLPYMRQDRKDKGRVPISAKRLAEIIEHNGVVQHVITFDLHADQEEGFFRASAWGKRLTIKI
jgi:ribose-phosphate pyrophosphokinase